MRTLWKGSLTLGTIAIPVGLASAVSSGRVSFRTLHAECGTPIAERRWCPLHERHVDSDELVKGWEVAPGQFVTVTADELAAIAPDNDRTIRILAVVPAGDVDPVMLDRAYYLAPDAQPLMRRPYLLLARILDETATVAIGRFTAWDSEHLFAIRPVRGRTLLLQTLHLPEDLVPAAAIEDALTTVEVSDGELHLGRELLMGKLFTALDRLELRSGHRERVQELLEAKLAGREITRPAEVTQPQQTAIPTVDLEDALRRSIRAARRPARKAKTPSRPAAAR